MGEEWRHGVAERELKAGQPSSAGRATRVGPGRAARALLSGSVDYAGLFPPAGLDMAGAVGRYLAYRSGPHGWMLGRFVVPASRLDQLQQAVEAATAADPRREPLPVSALARAGVVEDADRIQSLAAQGGRGAAQISTLELSGVAAPEGVDAALRLLPAGLPVFIELPHDAGEAYFHAVRAAGARAKIRSGGVTASAIPATQDLARLLVRCHAARLAFKATAGLHHAVRSVHRLTYEPDSPTAVLHGFLNVFLSAALLRCGRISTSDVAHVLEETSAEAFHIGPAAAAWRDSSLGAEELRAAREFACSFGSCSFEEPVADLQALGFI